MMVQENSTGSRQEMEKDRDVGKNKDVLSDPNKLIKGFIDAQVVRRGLDWRTGEAYRIDLEHFYKWLAGGDGQSMGESAVRGSGVVQGAGAMQGTGATQGSRAAQGSGTEQDLGAAQGRPDGLALDDLRWQEKMEDYLEYLALEKRLRPATVARKYRVFNYYLSYLVRQGLLLDKGPLRAVQSAGRPRRRGWDGDGPAGAEGMGDLAAAAGASDAVGGAVAGLAGATGSSGTGLADAAGCVAAGAVGGTVTGLKAAIGRAVDVPAGPAGGGMSKKDVDAFFLAMERESSSLDSDFRKRICLRDRVMMALLFYHGIEVSELLRLELSDYDRETGVLTVSRKRGKDRQVYLYSKALRERLGQWLMEHDCFEREGEYREQMFLSKLGRPLSMKMVINIFEKYRELAGIEKAVTPKDLKGSMGAYAKELMREVCG